MLHARCLLWSVWVGARRLPIAARYQSCKPVTDPTVPTVPQTTPADDPRCGDGIVQDGEACDDGDANADDAGCTSTCALAVCGDGLLWAGQEACDDGDANADDQACTTACEHATCGDGLLWADVEACDDGNLDGHDGCSPACVLPEVRSLAKADATLLGEATLDLTGISVAGAGDLNDDGIDDVIVGSYQYGKTNAGAVYVVNGPVKGDIDLGTASTRIVGTDFESLGFAVAGMGDINGDGTLDIVLGAPTATTWAATMVPPTCSTVR